MLSQPSSTQTESNKPPLKLWFGILVIYLTMFMATGYFAFVKTDLFASNYRQYEQLSKVTDQDTKSLLLEVIQKEESEHLERRNLASQSFHIVLGALLGFMSASTASLLKQKGNS